MKIYTKSGDKGQTGLFGGKRVKKQSARVEAYGSVDELNSFLALASAFITEHETAAILTDIQKDLFVLGADLATPSGSKTPKKTPRISSRHIRNLENIIDRVQTSLPPQTHFVLPGGSQASSALEVARSVCRRAERKLWALADKEDVNQEAVVYLNRLSDLLFVLARLINKKQGVLEIPWEPDGQ